MKKLLVLTACLIFSGLLLNCDNNAPVTPRHDNTDPTPKDTLSTHPNDTLSTHPKDSIPVHPSDSTPAPVFAGRWVGAIPKIQGYINDQIEITVIINKDSTYKLNAIYATTQDTALRDNGRWTVSQDTIYLNGNDCAVNDTITHILKILSSCGNPAAIKIDIKDNAWDVPFSALSPLGVAFNINLDDPTMKTILSMLKVRLYKK